MKCDLANFTLINYTPIRDGFKPLNLLTDLDSECQNDLELVYLLSVIK